MQRAEETFLEWLRRLRRGVMPFPPSPAPADYPPREVPFRPAPSVVARPTAATTRPPQPEYYPGEAPPQEPSGFQRFLAEQATKPGARALGAGLGFLGGEMEKIMKPLERVAEIPWRLSGYDEEAIEALKASGQLWEPLFFAAPPGAIATGGLPAAARELRAIGELGTKVKRAVPPAVTSYVQKAAKGAEFVVPTGKPTTAARKAVVGVRLADFKVSKYGADKFASQYTHPEGYVIERIARGKDRGKWRLQIGETEHIAKNAEGVVDIAKQRGAFIDFPAQQARRAQVAAGQAELPAAEAVAKAPSAAVPARGVAPKAVVPKAVAAPEVTEAVTAAWETGAPRPFAFDPNSTINQGRFRLLSPVPKGSYITRQSGTPGVSYIVDTKSNAIQSVRFNKAEFTEAKATQWWEANKTRLQPPAAGAIPPPAARPVGPSGITSPAAPLTRDQLLEQEIAAARAPMPGVGAPPAKPPGAPPVATGPVLPPPPSGPRIMGNLSDITEAIEISQRPDVWRTIANKPGLRTIFGALNPSAVANSPAHQAVVGRAILRDQAQQLSQVANARLNAIGTQQQIFGALTKEGLISKGPLKGLAANTVRTYPERYISKLTPAQARWIQAADDIERAKLRYLRENGIEIAELAFEEGGRYAGRRVFAKITQGGELVDAGYVGAGPGRPGAKLAAEKHRIFKTAEEAIEQGYRYIPEDEALFLNVQGAYNRVADKQMADWLLLRVPWRTTSAPDALKVAAYQAKQKLNRSRQLQAALNRAVRGERLPPATISSIEAAYPEQAQTLRGIVTKLQGPRPQTAEAVQSLRAEAKQLITEAQRDYAQSVAARATARERAMTTTFEEARIQAPAFAGKIFTGPEAKQTTRVLRESMEPGFNRALGAINQVNAVSRYFMLAGDASPMTIQLLYLAGASPKAYAGAARGFVRSLLDTRFQAKYLAQPENMAIVQKYPGLILSRGGATEFTEAMAHGGLLRKGPLKIGGKVLEPFQRGFEGALDVAGIEWLKALDRLGTTAARRADLAQFINEFRGLTSSARLGVSMGMRQAETAAILAPRYNRAIAALLFDTVHGGLRGDLARKSLARGVAAVAATSVVISWAMGENWQEILEHLNPASNKFMTWKVAGQNVGPGSKLRSVLRLFALSAKDPSKLLDTSVGWGELEYMRNPLIKFGRGLASPVVSGAWDLLTGKDFIGDPTRDGLLSFTEAVAENFMPIWVQTVAFEGGTIPERVTRGVAEFLGGRAYPGNVIWELSDKWRKDMQAYKDIPPEAEAKAKGLQTREDYRTSNPEIDAKLFLTGQVDTVKTTAALNAAARLMVENGLEVKDIKSLEEKEYEPSTKAEWRRRLQLAIDLVRKSPAAMQQPVQGQGMTEEEQWNRAVLERLELTPVGAR